jgi:hypothetical protein
MVNIKLIRKNLKAVNKRMTKSEQEEYEKLKRKRFEKSIKNMPVSNDYNSMYEDGSDMPVSFYP